MFPKILTVGWSSLPPRSTSKSALLLQGAELVLQRHCFARVSCPISSAAGRQQTHCLDADEGFELVMAASPGNLDLRDSASLISQHMVRR